MSGCTSPTCMYVNVHMPTRQHCSSSFCSVSLWTALLLSSPLRASAAMSSKFARPRFLPGIDVPHPAELTDPTLLQVCRRARDVSPIDRLIDCEREREIEIVRGGAPSE
eukprot:GHVU01063585.1.p1 GENE.GHVU01063585.1~~GHVU01063585.1.p1  ORF type:complete len:109 (+),score=10.63 GHVU01063585.1:201-527(+)